MIRDLCDRYVLKDALDKRLLEKKKLWTNSGRIFSKWQIFVLESATHNTYSSKHVWLHNQPYKTGENMVNHLLRHEDAV